MSLPSYTSLLHTRLAKFKSDKVEIAVYLKNGIKLTGHVVDFDDASVIITSRKAGVVGEIIIERSSIATTQPAGEPAFGRQ